jgi:hypothetical protein
VTTKPAFILPAYPGPAEAQLLVLGQTAAERELRPDEISEIVRLIGGGADLGICDRVGRCTVFEKLIHAAIQSEAIADLPQYKGQKLLGEIFAVAPDTANILKLIADGADLSQRDLYRRTALHMAVAADRADIAERLIDKGANIDAQDRDGQTALISAVQRKNTEIIRLLLDHDARLDLCTTCGHTALIASLPGKFDDPAVTPRMDIALLLARQGADITARIDGEKSALERLRETGRHDRCAELESAAAEYRRIVREHPQQDTAALKTLRQKKPGDKFKLRPRPPQ